jgi:hypothetical protein
VPPSPEDRFGTGRDVCGGGLKSSIIRLILMYFL